MNGALTQTEQHRLLVEWNDTRRAYRLDQPVHRWFEAQAARTPGALAAMFENRRLSYAELDAHAEQVARRLRRHGVGADTLVGICAERSLELVAGLLGILKAGGAYVPLDPSLPRQRLAWMLGDTAPPVVLTQRRFRGLLEGAAGIVMELDSDAWWSGEGATDPDRSDGDPDALCHVMYTSGSTGSPKGVMSTHRGLLNRLLWMQEEYSLGAVDRVLHKTPFGFDVSAWELFWPLITGAAVVLERPGEHRNPAALIQSILRFGITTIHFVPPMLDAFLEAPGVERCVSLRRVFCSGDVLGTATQKRFFARLDCELHNLYGPTEASIDVTHWRCDPASTEPAIPIGRPIANTQVYILDERRAPVAIGMPGELYLGGVGIARGYLHRPDLTAERFVPDPFSGEARSRLYRTGDLARYRPDGNIEFLGRLDHQVKIRGFRIELGEIEANLAEHPGVRHAVVLAREEPPGDKRLVAYLVLSPPDPSITALRRHAERELPDYMVPSAFVVLDRLPLTPNGKIDRAALASRLDLEVRVEAPYVPAATATQVAVAEIWAELLRVPRVGLQDDFFDLGGDSLVATRFISRLRDRLGVELPLRRLFESPTIEAIAHAIDQLASNPGTGSPPLIHAPRGLPLPLSFAQRGLWFLDRYQTDPAIYNVPLEVELDGALDVKALERALKLVVDRHDSLRTTFRVRDGQPFQEVTPSVVVALAAEDAADPAGDGRERFRRLLRDIACEPFDLERGPLLRARLFRLSAGRHVLILVIHHVVFDGWSADVLFGELFAAYEALSRNAVPGWPELRFQYADYAAWQWQSMSGETLRRELSHWTERLAGAPEALLLPYDHPRPAAPSGRGARAFRVMPATLFAQIVSLERRQGATLFMTLLAAAAELLRRYAGDDDLVIGALFAGRRRIELEGIIGLFANTLPLRLDLGGDPTVAELLRRVRETTLDAQAHQDLPFEKLIESINPAREPGRLAMLRVLFVLHRPPEPIFAGPELSVRYDEIETGTAKTDLTFLCDASRGELRVIAEYDTDLFEASTVERMLLQLERLLEGMVADPDRRASELEVLSDGERRRIVSEWNETVREYPSQASIHELFERQVARRADATAVASAAQRLTYGEVNAQANRLARHLVRRGVTPRTPVALCVERSAAAIVGMLAILKTGAFYLPLDPRSPTERLALLLEDGGARLVITDSKLAERLPAAATDVVRIDTEAVSWAKESSANLDCAVGSDDLAYVMYTSGSTGTPKGVEVLHRGVVRLVHGDHARFGPDTVFLQLAPLWFDASTFEIWGPLLHGATCAVASPERATPAEIGSEIARYGVTTLWLTKSWYDLIIDQQPSALRPVRQLLIGGEALSPAHVERGLRLLPDTEIINGYGPTESTTFATTFSIPRDWTARDGAIPIGRPIANTRAYVLDEHGHPLGVGMPGELHLAGDGLARGYRKRPELTAERFVPDPWSDQPGSRLYRTGDLARYRADGSIAFLGRADRQVKIRGFRVEPGEIESVLARCGGVRQSLVVARQDLAGDQRLVAYVVPWGREPSADALRGQLRQRLPEYMVPAAFVFVDALPLTASGKIDLRALPAAGDAAPVTNPSVAAPSTPAELALAEVWARVLDRPTIGIHDDFFALGGHSLLAVRLVAEIERRCGRVVPLVAVFTHPTIEQMARLLEDASIGVSFTRAVALQPSGGRPTFFCVPGVGGSAAGLQQLALQLAPEQPVRVIEFKGVDGREPPDDTVEAIADSCLDAMRRVQGRGPYYLGGYSAGGQIAFEMARRLVAQGDSVGLLVVLDAAAPGYPRKLPLAQRMPLHVVEAMRRRPDAGGPGRYFVARVKSRSLRVAKRLALPTRAEAPEPAPAVDAALARVGAATRAALRRYRPQPYSGRLILIRSTEVSPVARFAVAPEPAWGWEEFVCGGVEVRRVPGDHHSMLTAPHVRALGAELRAILEAEQAVSAV